MPLVMENDARRVAVERLSNADADGVSPTEREYDVATVKGKERLLFIKKCARDPREERFAQKVQSDVVRKSFETSLSDLRGRHHRHDRVCAGICDGAHCEKSIT